VEIEERCGSRYHHTKGSRGRGSGRCTLDLAMDRCGVSIIFVQKKEAMGAFHVLGLGYRTGSKEGGQKGHEGFTKEGGEGNAITRPNGGESSGPCIGWQQPSN